VKVANIVPVALEDTEAGTVVNAMLPKVNVIGALGMKPEPVAIIGPIPLVPEVEDSVSVASILVTVNVEGTNG